MRRRVRFLTPGIRPGRHARPAGVRPGRGDRASTSRSTRTIDGAGRRQGRPRRLGARVRELGGWPSRVPASTTSTTSTTCAARSRGSPTAASRPLLVVFVTPVLGGRPARRRARRAGRPRRLRALRRPPRPHGARPRRDRDLERGGRGRRSGAARRRRVPTPRCCAPPIRRSRPPTRTSPSSPAGMVGNNYELPVGRLRRRRRRVVRRGGRAHRHRLPAHLAGRVLPRAQRPRRALLVHGLPRGPRRDDRQRRRRQAHLDDGDRLEHRLAQGQAPAATAPSRARAPRA